MFSNIYSHTLLHRTGKHIAKRLTHRRVIFFAILGLSCLVLAYIKHWELCHDGAEFCLVPIIEHLVDTEVEVS